MDKCSAKNCDKLILCKGLCTNHYYAMKRNGHTDYIFEQHGKQNTPEYEVWASMKARCNNPNAQAYIYYGARGIKVCDEWNKSFMVFINDMGERPEGLTLDRINNNGNYEPSNCRWTDRVTQGFNRRMPKHNTSGYKGVGKRGNKWRATARKDKKNIAIGSFKTPELAKEALDKYYNR